MNDTLWVLGKAPRAAERKMLASEIWQFLMVVPGFFIVALLWLFVVYLPRTHHGALGGPTLWSWRRGDIVSGRFRQSLEAVNVESFTLSSWRHVPTP